MAMFPALMNDMMFSDLFDDPFFGDWRGTRNAGQDMTNGQGLMTMNSMMSTDVRDMGDKYDVDIDMPGFKKDDIKIELNNGYLTVTGYKNSATQTGADTADPDAANNGGQASGAGAEDGKWLRRERYSGACSRSFYVGDELKESDIHAKYENGTLCLTLPKMEAQPQVEQKHTIAIED
ncbi:Hsp20/alpha crystallin family protein [Bifidobacterium simiarum]|uniref:Hsp20/alpha crystallin family protein n=1 Tax=Bifidobacterium simiarum TaxID=2045441 RepID=UPI001BDD8473|nr:Hsp20/alpha crystallin family protein [Bifidobacterium simiarum]MBT1166402.1 Hsp20/alpha crystallin family protein [Bifidobacterium simiarum]